MLEAVLFESQKIRQNSLRRKIENSKNHEETTHQQHNNKAVLP